MASFLSNLFSKFSGGKSDTESTPSSRQPELHGGCRIYATPIREGNQYRLAGRIEKDVDGQTLTRTFVRADVFLSDDDAAEYTFKKGQQIIDQGSAYLFGDGAISRNA